MSQGGFNTFVSVVSYINKTWEPCHVTINIFEVHKNLRATMAIQVKDLFAWYGLCDKVIMYMWKTKVPISIPSLLPLQK
jgi:hypothetical protein